MNSISLIIFSSKSSLVNTRPRGVIEIKVGTKTFKNASRACVWL